jgi:predicted kinase
MAAGKTTHAKQLVVQKKAVLLSQDEYLEALYPDEILTSRTS